MHMDLQWMMIKRMLNVYQGESDDDGDDAMMTIVMMLMAMVMMMAMMIMMMVIMTHFLHQFDTYTCIYLPYLHHAIL